MEYLVIELNLIVVLVVDCGDPGAPRSGVREVSSTVFHSAVQYSCNHGYNLVGDKVRFCLASGEWSGSLPTCKRELVSPVV